MPEIVPRWEWRTFGERFGAADEAFAALTPDRVQEGDELYLLSAAGGDTVKVRDGVMDVKHLERVSDDGLEQWLPVLKADFPLPAADVGFVLAAMHVAAPPLERTAYALAELLEEIVHPRPELLAVEVHKRRQRYEIGECHAELTDVRTKQGATRTVAVESEDAARVIATVRELGLETRRNTSFPRGLKALAGFGAGRYAVIDVGTNSVKFHVGERTADGSWQTVVDRSEITRLGEGLEETGRLHTEPLARTVAAVVAMADEARAKGALAVAAVGTAGLRRASNSAELVDAVRVRSDVTVEVIPGEEEARLAYLAATAALGLEEGTLAVFDTGGGSSQFTFGRPGRIEERFSVDVGAARFTERFGMDGAVSEDVLASALEAIAGELARLDGRPSPDALVGMGGAVTNMAAVKLGLQTYDADAVQGTTLERSEVERQVELYRTRDAEGRRAIVGLQPKRAEVILAGSCIVRTVLAKLGKESLTVSDRGLRHGLLLERFG
jgi:exopolyphosphatase/guanosine-5'-triphosphate,3'-diphosphate pyrophosphatase